MTDTEILECGQSIYDFLLDDTDIQTNMSLWKFQPNIQNYEKDKQIL